MHTLNYNTKLLVEWQVAQNKQTNKKKTNKRNEIIQKLKDNRKR